MATTEAEKPPTQGERGSEEQEQNKEHSAKSEGDSKEQDGPQKQLERPSAHQIYKQVATSGREELKRSSTALAISGIAGGTFMGLTALGTAIAMNLLGDSPAAQFIAKMFYPIGFIVVMIGRAQLFTENTLYPVALVLAERRHLWNTLRLWSIVLPCNIVGAFVFSLLAAKTPAISLGVLHALNHLGVQAVSHPASTVFWTGVFAGWMIATAAWLVSGSHSVTGSILIIWLLTFIVGLGDFAHCIATSSGDPYHGPQPLEVASGAAYLHVAAGFAVAGQYLRRRRHGHAHRVWTGDPRRRKGQRQVIPEWNRAAFPGPPNR